MDVRIADNFSAYIIVEKSPTESEWIMIAATGKKIDYGIMEDRRPIFYANGKSWYHFTQNGQSQLVDITNKTIINLNEKYRSLKPIYLYDTLKKETMYLMAKNNDYKNVLLLPDSNFKKMQDLPAFEEFDKIYYEDGYTKFPIAIAIRRETPKELPKPVKKIATKPLTHKKRLPLPPPSAPSPIERYLITETDRQMTAFVYDSQLQFKGKTNCTDSAISVLLNKQVQLKQSIRVSPSMGDDGILTNTDDDHSCDLNNEFAIKKLDNGNYRERYCLIKKKDNAEPVKLLSYDARFYWQGDEEYKLLHIYIGVENPQTEFYFDFNGVALPKNKLMIPAKYYPLNKKIVQPYLFQE